MTASEGTSAAGPESEDRANPIEAALDLLVYAPLGLALSAADEVPKLAAVGRSQLEQRVKVARVVGRFAVEEGRRQIEERLRGLFGAPDEASAPDPSPNGAGEPVATATSPAYETTDGREAAGPAPHVSSLAIPGYDSLSASQVVQRLDGLEEAELEDVRLYEEANRGRRTIISRIQQLQAG